MEFPPPLRGGGRLAKIFKWGVWGIPCNRVGGGPLSGIQIDFWGYRRRMDLKIGKNWKYGGWGEGGEILRSGSGGVGEKLCGQIRSL